MPTQLELEQETKIGQLQESLSGLLDHFEKTAPVLEKQASLDEAIAKRAPGVVETLIKCGFLTEGQRDKAVAAVADPLKVLDSLEKTAQSVEEATKRAPAATATLGQGGSIKEAGATTPVGLDPSSRSKSAALDDANRRFLSAFGF